MEVLTSPLSQVLKPKALEIGRAEIWTQVLEVKLRSFCASVDFPQRLDAYPGRPIWLQIS